MRDTNLVNALREHAEWAEGNQWETPITLCDDLVEAADLIEVQAKEIDALRNELCLKCGNCALAHRAKRLKSNYASAAPIRCATTLTPRQRRRRRI